MYKVRLLINVALAVCAMIPGGLSARNQFLPNAKGVDGDDCSVQLLAQNGHESGGWIATPDVSYGGDVWEPSIKMSSGVVPSGKHGHIRATPSIPIYGNVMFSAAWPSSEPRKGIYAFGKSSEFACNEVFLDSKMDGSNGALYFDGKFLLTIHAKIMIANIVTHTIYDAETWEVLKITTHASVGSTAYSMAYDKSDGTIYGCFKDDNGTGFVFGTLDPNTGKRVKIRTWQFGLTALAFTHDGRLVGINPSGWLFEVDKSTGDMTEIGNTGLPSKYATSGAIDPRHGTYYYAVCNDDADGGAALYTVNPDDASVSKVYDIPDRMQIQGMYIPEDPAADGAPAAVGDLYAEFEDNALVGSVGFKCPTETYDGAAGTGSLSYRVMANDEEVASGAAGWGENVVADVALDSPGNYTFVVTVSNADGESPRTRLKRYVGDDAPNPVTNVVLERTDGYFSLSWGASVGSANGAWFDQSEVTYTVTRQPDNAVVASRIVETSFSEPVPADGEMKLYYYTVTPEFGLASGKSVASNKIPVGYVTAPYVEAFDNADAMLPYTIIDVDNDKKTWAWYSGGSKSPRATQSTTMPKDDWLITPPIKMEGGTAYKLTFSTWGNTKTTVENMEVKLGTSPTVEAMDVTILEPFEIMAASSDKMKVEEYVVAPAPGIYYIGFHAISPAKKSYLYIDDIELSSNIPAASPDAVTSLELIPDNYGRLSANISFNAPVTTVGGDPVGEIVKIELWRDNDLVKVFESPGAGDRLDYDDTVDQSRYYTYSVIPFNAVGAGRVREIRGFIGVNPPASVADVRLLELPDECMVELSW
ncbi:MAG: choice-of-anchor J domain-containing protein, partial [Muribaculaceae bacterium]|nr:choice-of-anchor J domain-containing protein [Muribaculaceae bacterium]